MPPGIPDASLEPLLRARASGAYSAPSNNLRTLGGVGPYSGTRRTRIEVEPLSERSGRDDFVDFLHSLARLAMRPYVHSGRLHQLPRACGAGDS